MIGARFDGPVEQINYFPQRHSVNGPGGDWYKMEQNEWKVQTNNGVVVEVIIKPHFPSTTAKKPDWFEVTYEYNNVQQQVSILITNPAPIPTAPIGSITFIIANP